MPSTAAPVVPTTQLEAAEIRLAGDLEALARAIEDGAAAAADHGHVAVDLRRVRSYRALPHRRAAAGPQDARWDLVAAYEHLAFAHQLQGDAARSTDAQRAAERERLALAA
ncbi:hypothetical protein [Patulibacter defluvii]|uniref:hypothetical protein n=1 Tax=Patulibacter defluvii TaxID=3095358 RepID=UPI002A761EEB|nr:hypothetical protein [Patulibacter sp. DM4]